LVFLKLEELEINAPDTLLPKTGVMLALVMAHIVLQENGLEILAVDGQCTDKDLLLQHLVLVLAAMVGVVQED
jgi:hypothetical protein